MKKNCLFLLLALGIGHTYAQNTDNRLISPAEAFAERKGTLLEKRFDEVGKTGFLNVQAEYITDLTKNDKIACIRFDIQSANSTEGPYALLDSNEVNGIISFLNYISANVISRPPVDPSTEISYTDNYNLQVGCFWQKNNGWVVYIRIDAENSSTEADILRPDFTNLLRILTLAKSEMQK